MPHHDASTTPSPETPRPARGFPPLLHSERLPVMLSHISTAIPVWGLALNAVLHFVYDEASRAVRRQARQGLHFQVLFLILAAAKYLADVAAIPLSHLTDAFAVRPLVDRTGLWALGAAYALYAAVCLRGAVRAARGRFTGYPFIGKHLRPILKK